eukprot:411664-Pyramimonas_sp.AAC.1
MKKDAIDAAVCTKGASKPCPHTHTHQRPLGTNALCAKRLPKLSSIRHLSSEKYFVPCTAATIVMCAPPVFGLARPSPAHGCWLLPGDPLWPDPVSPPGARRRAGRGAQQDLRGGLLQNDSEQQ